ncbi:MAG: hypothetical protein Q9223_007202 [Gallowayella weberi]
MAPSKQSPRAKIVTKSSSSENEDNTATTDNGRCASQGSDDQSVKDMAKALKESTKGQPTLNSGNLQGGLYRWNSSFKLHRARFETLKALLEGRASIEMEMSQSSTRIEKAFANANHELQTVLATRIENFNADTT